ncbi:MAG: hypothetical protein GXP44_01750 [bacterium]|nr:hypothetical protein [bacterium]
MKILKNKWARAIIVILGVLLAVYLAVVAKLTWDGYQKQAAIDRFQESIEKPFREDTYGGKTPEETWAMFLDALKKEDFALASKYYDVEHQTEARKKLEELKREKKFSSWIKEIKTLEKDDNAYQGDRAYYSYKYYDEETRQYLWSDVVFYLNPYTKVWKIIW